tara:strand:+ start:258 stop:2267 length:2010 start_codon:yes stop_codon:yes gene_type:complete
VSNLWFVECRAQAKHIKNLLKDNVPFEVVALTAEALQALEEFGIPHTSVSEYADTRPIGSTSKHLLSNCVELLRDIEDRILNSHGNTQDSDRGFLISHIYWFNFAASILATRVHLMHETIRACNPKTVSMFKLEGDAGYILRTAHPWFPSIPMNGLLNQLAQQYSFTISFNSYKTNRVKWWVSWRALYSFVQRVRYCVGSYWKVIRTISHNVIGTHDADMGNQSLLVLGGMNKELNTVTASLKATKVYVLNHANNEIMGGIQGCLGWSTVYNSKLISLTERTTIDLDLDSPEPDSEEIAHLNSLYDEWANQFDQTATVKFGDFDLLSDLITVLRPIAVYGLFLSRYVDRIAYRVLDAFSPDVVCFQGVNRMVDKRMALACEMEGIPTVGIQHGGSVGTHVNNSLEVNELAFCDYYLTYGNGIKPLSDPVVAQKAGLLAVGSPNIEQRVFGCNSLKQLDNERIRVLWISEKSYGNTIGQDQRSEDTRRYLLQKKYLNLLGACDQLKVTFRPMSDTVKILGTVLYIEQEPHLSINVDTTSNMDNLLLNSDIVITDISSSTVWNETIAFQKPLILYCNPQQTPLMSHFKSDLELACCWCSTEDDFLDALQRLTVDGKEYVAELRKVDTSDYLQRYVVHCNDGKSTERVNTFLKEISKKSQFATSIEGFNTTV